MPLTTTAQKQALKADILADPALEPRFRANDPDGLQMIADAYNAPASPAFVVFKKAQPPVRVEEIGDAIDATELDNLTSVKLQRLQTFAAYSGGTINPSTQDRRDFYDKVFAGTDGTVTRPRLAALWRRNATRAEKLFATGTGTTASPATMTYEGPVSVADVLNARNS
jgi:hypothetical protein